MPQKFQYSDDGSRYHTLKYHNMRIWGRPVYKAVVDAGFTCPNIDGSCGSGGCISLLLRFPSGNRYSGRARGYAFPTRTPGL